MKIVEEAWLAKMCETECAKDRDKESFENRDNEDCCEITKESKDEGLFLN